MVDIELGDAWSGIDLERDIKAEKETNESGEKKEVIDERLYFCYSFDF